VFIARDTNLTVGVKTVTRAPFVSLFSGVSTRGGNVGAKGSWERSQQKCTKTLGQLAGTFINTKNQFMHYSLQVFVCYFFPIFILQGKSLITKK